MMQTQSTAVFAEARALSTTSSTVYSFPSNRQRFFITEPKCDWRPAITEKLESLIKLELGWDGYQGKPVSFENANFALKMLERIYCNGAPAPQIVPGTAGDLQIEWHTHVADIELHVLAPNNVHAWISNEKTGPDGSDYPLTIDFTVVAQQLREMTEHSNDHAATA